MQTIPKPELADQNISLFLSELNQLIFKYNLLLKGNAGINVRKIPKDFKGYMAEKWNQGDGYDLREINLKLIYPNPPPS